MTINILGYDPCSINDGAGIREVLYIAQCTHKCEFCHNRDSWDSEGETKNIDELVELLTKNHMTDITLSGGDGLTVQYYKTLELTRKLKENSNKNIWVYTGYTWEELFENNKTEILKYIDVLVDGRFENDKRDITLAYRGSHNQRLINVQESLKQNKIILLDI